MTAFSYCQAMNSYLSGLAVSSCALIVDHGRAKQHMELPSDAYIIIAYSAVLLEARFQPLLCAALYQPVPAELTSNAEQASVLVCCHRFPKYLNLASNRSLT